MNEFEQIRKLVEEFVDKAGKGDTAEHAPDLEKATQTLKSLSEIEKTQAEIRKLAAEEEKIRHELEHASKQERLEGRQRYITLLTPLFTTLVLGLTLGLQTYQFFRTERDKLEAAEDAQWSDALKTVSQAEAGKMSPVALTLNPFLKSRRYADRARRTAFEVLSNTHDQVFADIFDEAFLPLDWENFDTVMQLDRTLGTRIGPLYHKSWKLDERVNDMRLLTPDEQHEYEYINDALPEISKSVIPLLKGPRPQGQSLDLSSTWFVECDWSEVNLYGANLVNFDLRRADLDGADLGGITSFGGAEIYYGTAWWDASRISPDFLDHLIRECPYDPAERYGTKHKQVSQQQYEDAIKRLRSAK
jgi:hypothetical protein